MAYKGIPVSVMEPRVVRHDKKGGTEGCSSYFAEQTGVMHNIHNLPSLQHLLLALSCPSTEGWPIA